MFNHTDIVKLKCADKSEFCGVCIALLSQHTRTSDLIRKSPVTFTAWLVQQAIITTSAAGE